MNMKKIISAFCALSMAVTSFAAMAVTANAEGETVLWSDTFNGYEVPETAYGEWCTNVLIQGAGQSGGQYKEIGGITLQVGSRNDGDDSTFWSLHEHADAAGDKYLHTATGRFATADRGAKMIFTDTEGNAVSYEADTDKDIVLAFEWSMIACRDENCTYDEAFAIKDKNGNITMVDRTAAGLEYSQWGNIKVVVSSTGTNVYVGDSETPIATSSNTSIASLDFSVYLSGVAGAAGSEYRIDGKPDDYPSHTFDDMVIYSTAAGAGLASTVPAAETHGAAEVTYTYAPVGVAPEGMNLIANHDFNASDVGRRIMTGGSPLNSTEFSGTVLSIGGDSEARGESNWSVTANIEASQDVTDKYLIAKNGRFSNGNRGAKLSFLSSVDADGNLVVGDIKERETIVVQFATRLHATSDCPAEVIFSGDLVAGSKNSLASPLAMITTDADAASSVYDVERGLTQGGENVLQVNDNEWVFVTITAYRAADKSANASIAVTTNVGEENETTTYIFGDAETMAGVTDNSGHGINNVPHVSFRSGNADTYTAVGTSNDIDNLAIYTDAEIVVPEVPDTTISDAVISADGLTVTSTEASETAVIVKVSTVDGAIKVEIIKGLDAGDKTLDWKTAPVAGDKIMVFNGWKSLTPAALVPVVIADAPAAE